MLFLKLPLRKCIIRASKPPVSATYWHALISQRGLFIITSPIKMPWDFALLDAIEKSIIECLIEPLQMCTDPLTCLMEISRELVGSLTSEDIEMGCPLNNLAQEMSSIDESFRTKVSSIYEMWRDGIAQAIAVGQRKGYVSSGVNPNDVAIFYISVMSGCRGLAKNARSADILQSCLQGIDTYLQALRA